MISKDNSVNLRAVLNGLVLAGGKSVRMGNDKGLMEWNGKPQRYYMADLLQPLCKNVFISCRSEQAADMSGYLTIPDSFSNIGPLAGLLSAFRYDPSAAWLVAACDLPLLDHSTLQYLVQYRDTKSIATAFESGYDGLPEPLITIWEPGSLPVLQSFLEQGITCPRKVLIRSAEQVMLIKPPDPKALTNANTADDAVVVRSILAQKKS